MRISEIHIYQKDLPIIGGPYTMAGVQLEAVDTTIVKIIADSGHIGWGETCPLGPAYQPQHAKGARAALTQMAPGLIGESAATPLLLRRKMNALLNGHNYAKAAIDIAVMDLLGKHYGVRLCELLGGAETESVPSYFAVGILEPDETARVAKEKVDEGYPRLQLKVGGRDVAIDIEAIRKTYEITGNRVRIAVDANRGLTMRDTIHLSNACRDIPLVIEQPCNTMDEIAAIRHQVAHPIYLDENTENPIDVLRAISVNTCNGFGFKVTRLGGVNAMATVRDMCAMRAMPHTCDDSWGGDIIAAACVHIGATVEPRLLEGVWIAAPYIEEHYDSENAITVEGGHISLPAGHGLGITPDENLFGAPVHSFN